MSVPKLRFKADDGSEFPELRKTTLGDIILSLHTGLNPRKFFQLNTPDAENYYVTIREIRNNQISFSDKTDKINDEALAMCNGRSHLEAGDVLFSGTGTIGETALIKETPRNWNIKEGVYVLKPDKDKVDSKYLLYLLSSPCFVKRMLGKTVRGTMISIPMKRLSETTVFIPLLSEQKKIANLFSALEALIEQTQSEITAWEERKRGVMQLLFNRKVRFKADDGSEFPEWEEKRLGEIFNERIERSDGSEMLLAVTIAKGITKQSESSKRNTASNDTSNYKVVHKGDLAYNTMRMWQGAEGVSSYHGIISPAYTVLICNDNNDPKLFEYMFKQQNMLHQFEKHSQGLTSDTWNLKYNNFSQIKVLVPSSLYEQQKIVACLSGFDDVINKAKKEMGTYQELKKGLMQQMFV